MLGYVPLIPANIYEKKSSWGDDLRMLQDAQPAGLLYFFLFLKELIVLHFSDWQMTFFH